MKLTNIVIPSLSLLMLSSCINVSDIVKSAVKNDNSPVKLIVYEGSSVSSIVTNDLFDIEYTQGEDDIRVIVTEKYADQVKLSISEGRVSVGFPEGFDCQTITARLLVSSPQLNSIESNGIGDITLMGNIMADELTLTSSGTGDIKIDTLAGRNVSLLSYGTGDISFNDISSNSINLETSGTGDIKGNHVNCNSLRLISSGTGDIKVAGKAFSTIANTSGTGDINIKKLNTSELSKQESGIGSIKSGNK